MITKVMMTARSWLVRAANVNQSSFLMSHTEDLSELQGELGGNTLLKHTHKQHGPVVRPRESIALPRRSMVIMMMSSRSACRVLQVRCQDGSCHIHRLLDVRSILKNIYLRCIASPL